MLLKINSKELQQFLGQSTFQKDGDSSEQEYGSLVIPLFPNCEEFWRIFVIPVTRRIEIPNGNFAEKIQFRDGIEPRLLDIASSHYSMFMHLAYAQWHYQNHKPSWLEDIYAHLASACDLAEITLENWYSLYLSCLGKESKILHYLSREEYLSIAGDWYDEYYADVYKYYYSHRKPKPVDLLKGEHHKNLLTEYYGANNGLKEYYRFTNMLRQYRNAVVHDVKLARPVDKKTNIEYIPKLEKIGKYRSWQAVHNIANNQEVIETDFSEISSQIDRSIQTLERCLNVLWEKFIKDVIDEFYSKERKVLRDFYSIEFTIAPTTNFVFSSDNEFSQNYSSPPSGTYATTHYQEMHEGTIPPGSATIISNDDD